MHISNPRLLTKQESMKFQEILELEQAEAAAKRAGWVWVLVLGIDFEFNVGRTNLCCTFGF